MALYQRGRIWYVDLYFQGKRLQESTGKTSKREAEKIHALRLADIARGTFALPSQVTLQALTEQYLAYARTQKRSWLRDEQIVVHLREFFGAALLRDIGPLRIEHYKQARLQKVSPATVNREIALLKHLFNLAEKWELYSGKNPMRSVRFLDENSHLFRTLSEEEEKRLFAECSPYLEDLVLFAVNTGLRSGDILNLTWEEVDLERRVIRPLIQKRRRTLEVPLNDKSEMVLRRWLAIRRGPYVFYNQETGDRFKDLWLGLKKACRRAGLDDVNWHTFRHTFASRLTRGGVDLVTVKELLGHSEISVTMRYAHTNFEAKSKAVLLLASGDKLVTVAASQS